MKIELRQDYSEPKNWVKKTYVTAGLQDSGYECWEWHFNEETGMDKAII